MFESKAYKTARQAYAVKCMVEYFVTLLVEDAFLSVLLTHLHLSDAEIGVISSFLTFAFLAKLFTIPLKQWRLPSKRKVLVFDVSQAVFFITLYLTPFLPLGETEKKIAVMCCIIGAYLFMNAISSISYKWFNSFVKPENRGSYSAVKEMVSLLGGIVFTVAVGLLFDTLKAAGKIETAFILFAVLIAVQYAVGIVMTLFCPDREEAEEKQKHSLSDVLRNTLGRREFLNVVIMTVLMECGRYFTIGYMGVFKTKDLALTLFTIQAISAAAKLLRFAVSRPAGRYSDRHGYAKGMELGLLVMASAFFVNIFLSKSTWGIAVVALYTVLYEVSLAGVNQNSFNIGYSYVSAEYITEAMAIKQAVGGLCGFAASILAGVLFDAIQKNGDMFLGFSVCGQQVLSAVSLVFVLLSWLYCRYVVCRQKTVLQ